MLNSTVTIELETSLKNQFEQICHELGMDMQTAFNIFARKMPREKRIPFEVAIDNFKQAISGINSGITKLEEHALIEPNKNQLSPKQLKTIEKAQQGDPKAQNVVGAYYESGNGVEKDYDKAIKWYTKAAQKGVANAQYHLGVLYNKIKNDPIKSYVWFEVAISCGFTSNPLFQAYVEQIAGKLSPSQIKVALNDAQQKVETIKQKAGKNS